MSCRASTRSRPATFDWQVQAVTAGGVVYADHGTWWRFTGQERDAETALDCFGARHYRAIQDDSPPSTPR